MLNRVTLIGNLGKDPEMRYTANGKAVTTFSVATSTRYDGKETTEWHSIVAWEKLAELCGEHLGKGRKVYVDGRIATRSWDKDGQKHYRTEIVANQVLFLDRAATDAPYTPPGEFDVDDLPFDS